MSNNEVLIQIETIKGIIKELNEISILCVDPNIKMRIEGIQSVISNALECNSKSSPAEDVIYEKMVEVKYLNSDLHLKLYMLYRDLVSGRISDMDAMVSLECLLSNT